MNLEKMPGRKSAENAELPENIDVPKREEDSEGFAQAREWHEEEWERQANAPDNIDNLGNPNKTPEDFMREEAEGDSVAFTKRLQAQAEERAWHEGRWSRQSEAKANKTFFGNPKKSPEDFRREEADRDNEDYNKRLHAEFEAWQESLKLVIAKFLEKAENPEKRCINVVYMKGGGMKSAYTGGQVLALNQMGLTSDKVDFIFGSSSGSVVAAAYAGGVEETKKGLKLLTGPLSSPDFINPSLGQLWRQNVINLEMAQKLMEEGELAFDEDQIRSYEGKLYFNVTKPIENGGPPEVDFLEMKDTQKNPSIAERIRSSMSIPGLTGKIPEIDGRKYYDGDFNQLPMEEVIAKVKDELPEEMKNYEINILVLPQTPFELMDNIEPSQTEYNMASLTRAANQAPFGDKASLELHEKLLLVREEMRNDLEEIQRLEGVNIGIMWTPNDGSEPLNTDPDAARASIISSARDTFKQFGKPQPDSIEY